MNSGYVQAEDLTWKCATCRESLVVGTVTVSYLGSQFTATFRWLDRARGEIQPVITGSAHVNSESTLMLNDNDPFCWGIR